MLLSITLVLTQKDLESLVLIVRYRLLWHRENRESSFGKLRLLGCSVLLQRELKRQ
jgi:hypothetical protein